MSLEKVIFGFFVLLAATLNFGFFIGDIDDPVKRRNEASRRQRLGQEIADPAERAPQAEFHADQPVENGAMRNRK